MPADTIKRINAPRAVISAAAVLTIFLQGVSAEHVLGSGTTTVTTTTTTVPGSTTQSFP